MKKAVVIGSKGTIGAAILRELRTRAWQVEELHRGNCDYNAESLVERAKAISAESDIDAVYCCIGVLHNDSLSPEKRLLHLNQEALAQYFQVNTILPSLVMRAFAPQLPKQAVSRFVVLSAMVGSIADNQLGGWYGYRSSKAALNMMVKTTAIEIARTHKNASIVAVHPGTTRGALSKPFASRVNDENYYTPEQSAQRIIKLADQLTSADSGRLFNWDGSQLPW